MTLYQYCNTIVTFSSLVLKKKLYYDSFPGLSEEHISSAQTVVNSLQVLETLSPSAHPSLSSQLFSLLPQLLSCLCSPYTVIRHMAARCFATLAQVQLHTTMQVIVTG